MTTIQRVAIAASVLLCITVSLFAQQPASTLAADGSASAEFTITEKVVRTADKVPPSSRRRACWS